MSIIFFFPLTLIALFESQIAHSRSERLRAYFSGPVPEEEGDPKVEDPSCDDDGGVICRVKFEELVKAFPKYGFFPSSLKPKRINISKPRRSQADHQHGRDGVRRNQPRDYRHARLSRRPREAYSRHVGRAR